MLLQNHPASSGILVSGVYFEIGGTGEGVVVCGYLERMLDGLVERYPGEICIVPLDEEVLARARETWRVCAEKLEPMLEEAYQRRLEAWEKASRTVIG